jgi:predicted DNA-binding protein with PD1-like motif
MYTIENNIIMTKFEKGEILTNLMNLMKDLKIESAGILNGIGMLKNTSIGYFDGKTYIEEKIKGPSELVSLQGNIGKREDNYVIHAHVGLSDKKHVLKGGHLIKGEVEIVNEIMLYLFKEIVIKRRKKGKLLRMVLDKKKDMMDDKKKNTNNRVSK